MRHFVIFLITFYQKYLSPYKGFRCAYACYHNSVSCSGAVKNIIAEHGLIAGWSLIGKQFQDCRLAYEALQQDDDNSNRRNNRRRNRPNQRNNCSAAKKKCEVVDCIPDLPCPDLPCDAIPCNFLRISSIKKSIHKNTALD